MGGNGVGGAVRERETLRVGEAIGRNRVRQIGEGRGKMPLVASHSDAHMQAKHARAHADLQSRLLFIVSLLAKEITSGALNQINKVRGVSELSLLHLRILSALQWWAERKATLNQRDIERERARELDTAGITLFFSYCGFLSFHQEQIRWPVAFGSFCHSSPEHFLLVCPTGALQWIVRGRAGGGEAVPHGGVLSYGCWHIPSGHERNWIQPEQRKQTPPPRTLHWASPPGITLSPGQLFSMYLSVRLFPVFRAPGQCANGKWLRVPQPGSACPGFPCRCCSCSCVRLCLWPAMTPTGPSVPRGAPTPRRLPWWGGMCAATTTSRGMCARGNSSPTRSSFSGSIRTEKSTAPKARTIRTVSNARFPPLSFHMWVP